MSEWTTDTLKAHYDAILTERAVQYQQRFEAGEKRLDAMNEFRQALNDAQKTYITRDAARNLILAACTITGTIVAVITFFMRK